MAMLDTAGKVLDIEASALLAARARLGTDFQSVVELIKTACPPGKVVVMGIGKSGLVGQKIAATLSSTGTPSFFIHPTEAGHGDLGMISAHDVVLALSYSGHAQEILLLGPYFKRHGIPVIALTGNLHSPLAELADLVIDGSVAEEACPLGLAPTASTAVAMALGDALAVCLLEARGFGKEDFAMTHPSGALGRRLLVHVRDIMVKGGDVPRVNDTTTIRDSLVEMSRGGMGFTAVETAEGTLCGIFTDGDLRRALDANVDIMKTPVGLVMGKEPKTISPNQLAAAAAEVMQRGKVSAVLVTEAGRLVGALNTRILLREGIL